MSKSHVRSILLGFFLSTGCSTGANGPSSEDSGGAGGGNTASGSANGGDGNSGNGNSGDGGTRGSAGGSSSNDGGSPARGGTDGVAGTSGAVGGEATQGDAGAGARGATAEGGAGAGGDGAGGAGNTSALCSEGCTATLEADCENGPVSREQCEANCTSLGMGDCATEYGLLQECARDEEITCSEEGFPVILACETEQGIFIECINQ